MDNRDDSSAVLLLVSTVSTDALCVIDLLCEARRWSPIRLHYSDGYGSIPIDTVYWMNIHLPAILM